MPDLTCRSPPQPPSTCNACPHLSFTSPASQHMQCLTSPVVHLPSLVHLLLQPVGLILKLALLPPYFSDGASGLRLTPSLPLTLFSRRAIPSPSVFLLQVGSKLGELLPSMEAGSPISDTFRVRGAEGSRGGKGL